MNINNQNRLENYKCIWMSSGVVEYKLCDKNFACENCEFDRVIRNVSNHKENDVEILKTSKEVITTIIDKLKPETNIEKVSVLKNQLMVKNLFSDIHYIGINPGIFSLLDNITGVIIQDSRNFINKDEEFFTLKGDWGEVTFTAPMDFFFLGKINTAVSDFINNKWFGMIQTVPQSINSASLSLENLNLIISKTKEELFHYNITHPEVGNTMYDGGEYHKFLYQIIGKEAYLNLLNKLIKV